MLQRSEPVWLAWHSREKALAFQNGEIPGAQTPVSNLGSCCSAVLRHVPPFVTPGTVAHQATPGKNTELPFAVPGDSPDPGIKPVSPVSPALADCFYTTSATCTGSPSCLILTNC